MRERRSRIWQDTGKYHVGIILHWESAAKDEMLATGLTASIAVSMYPGQKIEFSWRFCTAQEYLVAQMMRARKASWVKVGYKQ